MITLGLAILLNPAQWKLGLREYGAEDWYHVGPVALVVGRNR